MKRLVVLVVGIVVVLASCSTGDSATTTTMDTSQQSTTSSAGTDAPGTTTSTASPTADLCEGPFPAFPANLAPDPLDVEGTPGPAPGSPPPDASQVVAHWLRDAAVTVEMRWPATSIPVEDGEPILGGAFDATLWPPSPENSAGRVIAQVVIDPNDDGPCSTLSVEGFAARPEPIYDELFVFVTSLRPAAEKADYVAEVLASQVPVTGTERPPGRCEEPIATASNEFGYPTDEAASALIDNFLADRREGKAAEQCLTVAALGSYEAQDPASPYPGPCLFECEQGAIRFVDAEIAYIADGNAQLLVTYRLADGSDVRLRETMMLAAVPDRNREHTALIQNVFIGPESYVEDAVGRRVIEDMLDALAAGEYDIALSYIVNEGFSQEIEDRLGDPFRDTPQRLFTDFCRRAVCDAEFTIGDVVFVDEWSRSYRVTFETTQGTIPVDIRTGMFEGIVTANNLPPDGTTAIPADRIDERIFGREYQGPLTIVRHQAVERITAGLSNWGQLWRARWLGRFSVVDGTVIEQRPENMGGGVYRLSVGDNAANLIAEAPATLLGAYRAANRAVAFVVGSTGTLDAVDLATGSVTTLRDYSQFDESPYAVDGATGTDRLLITLGAGESTWFELFEFNESTLQLGRLVKRIDPAGALGIGHLGPTAETIVASYDDDFYDPVQTVALIDASSGGVLGRWTVADPDTIGDLDFDGRFIVGHLDGGGLVVIDTETANVRRVDTGVRVRFG